MSVHCNTNCTMSVDRHAGTVSWSSAGPLHGVQICMHACRHAMIMTSACAGRGRPGCSAVLGAALGDGGGGARGAARRPGAGARGSGRHHALPPAGALPARHVRARGGPGSCGRGDHPVVSVTSCGAELWDRVGITVNCRQQALCLRDSFMRVAGLEAADDVMLNSEGLVHTHRP